MPSRNGESLPPSRQGLAIGNPQDAFGRILVSLHDAMLDDAHRPAASALIDAACRIEGNRLVFVAPCPRRHAQIFMTWFRHRRQRREDCERQRCGACQLLMFL